MNNNQPIGIFDSGLGGLTVVKEIKKKNLQQPIIYLGDTARVPYGTRSREVVQEFAVQDAKFLESQGVSQIVIACHTASALATEEVKKAVSVPVLEMISPTAQAAQRETKNKRVGLIATRGTVNSHVYKNLLEPEIQLIEQACPLLVPLIEEGETDGEIIEKLLVRYLQPIKEFDVDVLIMGCTHYPILENLIQQEMGDTVTLLNPGIEIAKQLKIDDLEKGEDKYFVTDLTPRYAEVAERFLGQAIIPELVKI